MAPVYRDVNFPGVFLYTFSIKIYKYAFSKKLKL
jgi:hypothetical protein